MTQQGAACRHLCRTVVTGAFLLVAGCGGGSQAPTDSPPSGRPLASAPVPELVKRQCRALAKEHEVTVRCPGRIPAVSATARLADLLIPEGSGDFGDGRCAWLTGYQYRRAPGNDRGPVFHLLIGGRCDPFPLSTRAGRWPARVGGIEPSLRLVGYGSLSLGDPAGTPPPRVRPRVVARTTVREAPALVLAFGPLPGSGTVHGGHEAIVFNDRGDGQTVSMHFARGSRSQRIALLQRVAASMGGG